MCWVFKLISLTLNVIWCQSLNAAGNPSPAACTSEGFLSLVLKIQVYSGQYLLSFVNMFLLYSIRPSGFQGQKNADFFLTNFFFLDYY